jgi:sterol desaturase/sphingolipid hydroxylase (fatty acid hydroxylase superfamily)
MLNSSPSTACSSPNMDSVEKIIHNDQVRYKRKGYGLIVAIIISVLYFTVVPKVLHNIFPTLIEGVDIGNFLVLSAWCAHVGFNFTAYCLSYFVYTSKHPFLERYRILQKPWPWEENREDWKKLFKEAVGCFLLHQCFITPLLVFIDIKLNGVFCGTGTENFPTIPEIILQCFFCMIVDDFFFYWGHRLLHHPKLYPKVHKIHHRWHHAVIISNECSHPLEYIIANLPAALGPKILGKRMHMTTLWMWIIMRVGESLDSHCGYEFSWSPYRLLPLSGSTTFHDYHHSTNVGNYGSYFTFWDTFCGTNKDYYVWLAKRERESTVAEFRNEYNKMKEKSLNDPDAKQAQVNELSHSVQEELDSVKKTQ